MVEKKKHAKAPCLLCRLGPLNPTVFFLSPFPTPSSVSLIYNQLRPASQCSQYHHHHYNDDFHPRLSRCRRHAGTLLLALSVPATASRRGSGRNRRRLQLTSDGWECNDRSLLRYMEKQTDLDIQGITCNRKSKRNLACVASVAGLNSAIIPFSIKCKGRGWRRPFYGSGRSLRAKNAILAGLVITGVSASDTSAQQIKQALVNVIGNDAVSRSEVNVLALEDGSIEVVVGLNVAGSGSELTCTIYNALGGATGEAFGPLLDEFQALNSDFQDADVMRVAFSCPKCELGGCELPPTEPVDFGLFTRITYAFDPTCTPNVGTTFIEFASRPFNECVSCFCNANLTRRVEITEACAPGIDLFGKVYEGEEKASCPSDFLSRPGSTPLNETIGECFEDASTPGLYGELLCGSLETAVCASPRFPNATKQGLLTVTLTPDSGCSPEGAEVLYLIADGVTCSPIGTPDGNLLYIKGTLDTDGACSSATGLSRTVHTDQLCTSMPIPGISGTFPLNTCSAGDPLGGGRNINVKCSCPTEE